MIAGRSDKCYSSCKMHSSRRVEKRENQNESYIRCTMVFIIHSSMHMHKYMSFKIIEIFVQILKIVNMNGFNIELLSSTSY